MTAHTTHGHDEAEHHLIPLGVYFRVFWALMAFLVLTLFAAYFNLGALNLPIALGIAAAKALIVVLYFMHVKFSSRLVMVFAGSGIVWLVILFVLTLSDYVSRPWLPVPGAGG